ncbi:ankyrin-1-like [Chenopodium quinoa]|uniref:ankyrin-1-like n=1 Tax=Chenopodium quinoa TaxID=63459 RepID=UPI000B77F140|nr:ankyrin-1-like [Chenopodium quinoa]
MVWRVENSKGNTPLHVALVHDNVKIAKFLLEKDPSLACIVNKSKEAPLHLAIKHLVNYSESESIMAKIKQPITEGGAALATTFVPGEDMSSLILFLIEKWSHVTCWPDTNGSTPLHSAASLNSPYNLEVIKKILYHWLQSAEVCDASGKSILHLVITRLPNYQQVKNLLKFKEIYVLRNCQDILGDTPLHIAARNKDINMVRVLLESSTKLSIKNMEGVSVASLIQQHNLLEMLRKRNMTLEESEAADKRDIAFLRQRMSKLGMEKLEIMEFLLSHDSKGRNILHKLLQIQNESRIMHDDFVDFIQQLLEKFPSLVCQTGLLLLLLELCNQSILRSQEQTPWLVQNAEGNTPLHEALVANNTTLVKRLLMHDPRSAGVANKCKELPLHLLAECPMSKYFNFNKYYFLFIILNCLVVFCIRHG